MKYIRYFHHMENGVPPPPPRHSGSVHKGQIRRWNPRFTRATLFILFNGFTSVKIKNKRLVALFGTHIPSPSVYIGEYSFGGVRVIDDWSK